MTKKHFQAFADYIRTNADRFSPETKYELESMVISVAREFNGRFDPDRFRTAATPKNQSLGTDCNRYSMEVSMDCLDEYPDYCTVLPTIKRWGYLAVVMRYRRDLDSYLPVQTWGPLAKIEAETMARKWARAGGLEFRS